CNAVRGGKLLYVFGGYGQENRQTNKIHVFDSVNRAWTEPEVKGTPPIPRDSHTCTTVGDSLFVFGGTDGRNPLNDLHVLDTSSNTWSSPMMRGDGPEAREGHGAALVGKRLFIFGGCGKSEDGEIYYDNLYILNTETCVWKRVTPSGTPPTKRDSHTCSSFKNRIIVIGGEDSCDFYLSDIHILDTDALIWCKLNTTGQLLPPRAGHTTVSFGKNLFVFGGFSDEQNLYDDVYVLNIETAVWTKVIDTGEGPSARFSMAGECLDPQLGGVLVFFGGCNKNLEALDDIYFLHTGLVREIDRDAVEKLSLRKQLKLKCQEQYTHAPSYNDGNNANVHHDVLVSSWGHPGQNINFSEFQTPLGKKRFQAKVTETFQGGCSIETVIDGKPLRGVLFSNKPRSNKRPAENSNRIIEHNAKDVGQCDDDDRKRPMALESNIEVSPLRNHFYSVSQQVLVAVKSPVASYAGKEYNGQVDGSLPNSGIANPNASSVEDVVTPSLN
ncbi:hypothetical protein Leryth_021892, partial [Lithospermum erythrorhizon]